MKTGQKYQELGEVCNVINGLWTGKKEPFVNIAVIRNTNFSKDCRLKLDDVAYIDVESKQFKTRKLEVGDIIIEKSGGSEKQPVGRAVMFDIPDGDFSFSNFTAALRVKDKSYINPKFLHKCLLGHYLKGETLKMQSKTTGLHNLDMKAYLKLPVPALSLTEQERIVAELDLLTGIIDKQKAQLAELDTLALSIFYDMFGNPESNEKGWITDKFQNVCCELFAGGDVPKGHCSSLMSDEYCIPILSNGVGEKAIYGYTDKARVSQECITISGRGTIGYCEVREKPFFPVVRLIVAVPKKDTILSIFLKFVVDALHLHGVGVAIPQLTIPMVKDIPIVLPPLYLQQSFAEKIQSIESQKASINQSIAETQKLFDYTMDKYFG